MGLYVLFASLAVLFIASLVGFFVTRADSDAWYSPAAPPPPRGLWLSTLLVFVISAAMESARSAVKKNRLTILPRRLLFGLLAAIVFLLAQASNWYSISHVAFAAKPPQVVIGFILLTGLHAAHVIGGLVPLSIVLARARDREYSSSRYEGVSLCTDYWHFLAVVWLVLFFVIETFS
jgi:cytochrome c oxidase subunit 3